MNVACYPCRTDPPKARTRGRWPDGRRLLAMLLMLALGNAAEAAQSPSPDRLGEGKEAPKSAAAKPRAGRKPKPSSRSTVAWRRTSRGWEAVSGHDDAPLRPLAIHPLLLAAFQLLVSLYALLASQTSLSSTTITMHGQRRQEDPDQRPRRLPQRTLVPWTENNNIAPDV